VRRVFRMVGAEGRPMNAVKKAFDREGVPTRVALDSGIRRTYEG
jgi:hypothetical protein